ncbi:QWRF motif-containing protein 2-like [Musa acuminata AAA Group]|uniref:QWRF motif-containing protein 2-like n=1 Tax=Musa acuminata AAA Group TaxID=214697 RepID=UPI0031E30240
MVAAVPAAATTSPAASRNPPRSHKNTSPLPRRDDLQNPRRSPLIPSEKSNAAAGARQPRTKEIGSRYLSSCGSSSSSSSTSYSTATTFSSSSGSSSSRRFPSPMAAPRSSTPPVLPQSAAQKRSHSVDRARPSTPRADPRPAPAEPSPAARALCLTTRSLSVSFQCESFFYQTSRAKAASRSPARKSTPERRRASASFASPLKVGDHLDNSKPFENHHRWPSSTAQPSNPLMRISNCSAEKKEPILATVRFQQSMMFDDSARRASFDGCDLSASSDTDSVSSGSNSGAPEFSMRPRAKVTSRGISVPARFWQETNSRLHRYPETCSPLSSPDSRSVVQSKLGVIKKLSMDSPLSSPRSVSSPLRGPVRPSSPNKLSASPSRGMASPLRTRSNVSMSSSLVCQPGNAPSIISFAAEVRRARKGENRIDEAHMLRLLDNRHLQWRCVNARFDAALLLRKLTVEKNLTDAWVTTKELRDSITNKRIKLQTLKQDLKLISILKEQMAYLEEWSLMEKDHLSSLSEAIKALKASTLRLPIVGGAKADLLEVKDAISSALDIMQAMGSSICSLLSKVEGMSNLISEITKVAAQERALVDRSRGLLSTVAALSIKQCSLQGQLIQLKRRASLI